MFSRDLTHIPPSTIEVTRSDRQRTNVIFSDILESIRNVGIMNPLLVERETRRLVAGERRLCAALELGLAEVPIRWVEPGTSPLDLQIIELEENLKRQDLVWQDTVRAHNRIHKLFLSRDPDWTAAETAAALAIQRGTLSVWMSIGAVPEDDQLIWGAGTAREAYNIILRRQERMRGNQMDEVLKLGEGILDADPDDILQPLAAKPIPVGVLDADEEPEGDVPSFPMVARGKASVGPAVVEHPDGAVFVAPTPGVALTPSVESLDEDEPPIMSGVSFLEWAPTYSGPKFNFLHCDFPYGVGVFDGDNAGGKRHEHEYEDTPDTYFALVECLCKHLDRFCSASAHLMFWFSGRHEARTRQMFADLAPSIQFSPYPLIWHKTDNKGIVGDHRRHPRHVFESCLFGYRAGRNIIRTVADTYGAPTAKSQHVSAKPVPMLKHFMTMIVDEHTSLLDPTCGSGNALQAAEALGAKRTLGLEIDPDVGVEALVALERFRRLNAVGMG